MYCETLFAGLDRRLDKQMSIDDIADELCPGITKKRDKIIKVIKMHRGGDYLLQNYEWLGYHIENIRNPSGKGGLPRSDYKRDVKPALNTKYLPMEKRIECIEQLTKMCEDLDKMSDDFMGTTEARSIWKVHAITKRVRELRMILKNRG